MFNWQLNQMKYGGEILSGQLKKTKEGTVFLKFSMIWTYLKIYAQIWELANQLGSHLISLLVFKYFSNFNTQEQSMMQSAL